MLLINSNHSHKLKTTLCKSTIHLKGLNQIIPFLFCIWHNGDILWPRSNYSYPVAYIIGICSGLGQDLPWGYMLCSKPEHTLGYIVF